MHLLLTVALFLAPADPTPPPVVTPIPVVIVVGPPAPGVAWGRPVAVPQQMPQTCTGPQCQQQQQQVQRFRVFTRLFR